MSNNARKMKGLPLRRGLINKGYKIIINIKKYSEVIKWERQGTNY